MTATATATPIAPDPQLARVVREAERAAEAERLRADNVRLKQEADKRLAAEMKKRQEIEAAADKAAAERSAHEMVLRKERETREQLERDAAELRAANDRRKAEEEEARRAAELAPDAEKLRTLARTVRSLELPEPGSAAAKKAVGRFVAAMIAAVKELERDAAALK